MKRKIKKIILVAIALLLLFSIYLNTFLVVRYDVLPIKYLILYFSIFLLIPLILIYLTIFVKLKKIIKGILVFFELLFIIILCFAFFYLNRTFNFIDDFTSGYGYETKNYYVLVSSESDLKEIKELDNKNIGYALNLDTSIDDAMDSLDKKVKLEHVEYHNFLDILTALQNNEVSSMLIIDSFYDMLCEDDDIVSDSTKIIYEFSIKEKVEEFQKDVDVTKKVFNIYISGIDSYSSVTDQTRSDVNIVASVNPVTKQILMVNIPRDYYVELAEINQKDKLTHAGMYGVETSVKTIENLLDIEINYYIKVNYSALIDIVDTLDGVDVYSNYNFTSAEHYYKFHKGYNHVNGKQALDFVRTRKAFLYGDRVRGENQQAMIEAIIKKAASPSILMKYDDILKSLEGNFTTNISTERITDLVKFQLDTMPSWNITSVGLNGTDGSDYTYTYPGQQLYVMIPTEDSILEIKNQLQEIK